MSSSSDRSFPNRKARALHDHLRERLGDRETDEIYVKARTIAQEIGLSSQEIGVLLGQLQKTETDLEVEKWAWSRATTWRISLSER
jgi:hypothetical protein